MHGRSSNPNSFPQRLFPFLCYTLARPPGAWDVSLAAAYLVMTSNAAGHYITFELVAAGSRLDLAATLDEATGNGDLEWSRKGCWGSVNEHWPLWTFWVSRDRQTIPLLWGQQEGSCHRGARCGMRYYEAIRVCGAELEDVLGTPSTVHWRITLSRGISNVVGYFLRRPFGDRTYRALKSNKPRKISVLFQEVPEVRI